MSHLYGASRKAAETADAFRNKWLPILTKRAAKFQSQVNYLVFKPLADGGDAESVELSVHAQFLIEDSLRKFQEAVLEMAQEHRQIHPPISKCGKDLERFFQSDLSGLMRGEKNVESPDADNLYRPVVNRLIFEHLLSLGRVEIAEQFVKECPDAATFALPTTEHFELMRSIMIPLRKRQYQPAIRYVETHAPNQTHLLFWLHIEHILQLLENNEKKEAILYCRALQPFAAAYKTEIQRLMFMAVSWSANTKTLNKDRFEKMFPEGRWMTIESDMAACLSDHTECPLANLVRIGAKAIPTLLKMHALIRCGPYKTISHHNHFTPLPSTVPFGDLAPHAMIEELFCEVPVESRVHSSFCCPVMRTQASENNPPMRLHCGHVISADALTRLSANRAQLVKCPYCPEESSASDAVRIYF